jgi:hypothetical protein
MTINMYRYYHFIFNDNRCIVSSVAIFEGNWKSENGGVMG